MCLCLHASCEWVLAGRLPGAVYPDGALPRSHRERPKASRAFDQLAVLVGPAAFPPRSFPGFPAELRLNPHHPGLAGLLLWRSVSSVQTQCQRDPLLTLLPHISSACRVLKHAIWQQLGMVMRSVVSARDPCMKSFTFSSW